MVLEERITLMTRLGDYLSSQEPAWEAAVENAYLHNGWFIPEYTRLAVSHIVQQFLRKDKLERWLAPYPVFSDSDLPTPVVGLVMAGNIPLVGFHDFLSAFLAGCNLLIKCSAKDTVLWRHLLDRLSDWSPDFSKRVVSAEMLKGCDAYIATGSNNSARYFAYYFEKYPHIIRSNRTSIAILTGEETTEELAALSEDICTYFGLGCRNVTKVFVPEGYNFVPLLQALDTFAYQSDYSKYKNNYDYQLALFLLNKIPYMSSQSMLLVPSESVFAPISVLHYGYYSAQSTLQGEIEELRDEIQCIVAGKRFVPFDHDLPVIPFGTTQQPSLTDYADGVNTLDFFSGLKKM